MSFHHLMFQVILGTVISFGWVIAQAQQPGGKSVLIIDSYHLGHPWVKSYHQGITGILNEHYSIKSFQMDTKRRKAEEFDQIAQEAWSKYQETKPLAVILGDDNALRLLGPKFVKEKNVQVVFLGINNNPRVYGVLGQNHISGILERPLIKRSILLMNKLLPINRALVVFDDSVTSKVVLKEIFNNQENIKIGKTVVDIILTNDFAEWQSVTSKEKPYDAIFMGLYHTVKDSTTGKHVDANTVLEWVSKNTKKPLFAFWNFSVGTNKAMGGYVLHGEEQGKSAAVMLLEMVNKKPADYNMLPVTGETGRYMFSRSETKRWNLKPDKIGDNAIWVD